MNSRLAKCEAPFLANNIFALAFVDVCVDIDRRSWRCGIAMGTLAVPHYF